MKRFLIWGGFAFGLALGAGLVYAFYLSEAMRLATVGVGAFVLAALTIGGTALAVNRQWAHTLQGQRSPHIIHNHRYPALNGEQAMGHERVWSTTDLPPLVTGWSDQPDAGDDFDDEVVA